jgi:hypothetical protein
VIEQQFMGGWTDWALKNQRQLAQDEPLNWVMQLGTHETYNTYADGHIAPESFPNQIYSTTDQLRSGARVITFDLYWYKSAARLCHSLGWPTPHNDLTEKVCMDQPRNALYDPLVVSEVLVRPSMRYYSNGIEEIRRWLDANPNEIVMIDFEEYVPQMAAADGFIADEAVLAPIRTYLGDMVYRPPLVKQASVTGSITTASFTGSINTGVLTVTTVGSGTLHVGDEITGAGIAPGTLIQSFGTVTGDGTGTYNLKYAPDAQPTSVNSETMYTGVLTVTAVDSGKLLVGEQITAPGILPFQPGFIPDGTFIQSFGTGTGGTGTYNLNKATVTGSISTASFTGSISTLFLNVTAVASGTLHFGDYIHGAGIPQGTTIGDIIPLSGTAGGTGIYFLQYAKDQSSVVVGTETMYAGALTVTAVDSGGLYVGDQITGAGIPDGTLITLGPPGPGSTGPFGTGVTDSVTGSITGEVLTVTAVVSGTPFVGEQITGLGIPPGTFIQSVIQPFGTVPGGTGTYILNQAALTGPSERINTGPFHPYDLNTVTLNVPSETITTTLNVPSETINAATPYGAFPERWPTRREMLAAGKRVIIPDNALMKFNFAKAGSPNEFLFDEHELISGSFGSGTWSAKNQRRFPDCFPHDPANPTPFDTNFHRALFTGGTIVVEERELDTFPNDYGFSSLAFPGNILGLGALESGPDIPSPFPTRNVGRLSDQGIVDATECNYSFIVLDRYSSPLGVPDGTDPFFNDPYPPQLTSVDDQNPVEPADFHRQALAVWSWKPGDRGQNGNCAMLEGSSGRWISADCTSNNNKARFACAMPRSESGEDPLTWQDPLGNDWKVTSATGLWDAGESTCQAEFGSDGFVFSAPRNGYQNRKLKDAAGTATDNIWLNYSQRAGDGQWVTGGGGSSAAPAPVAKAGPNQVAECGTSVTLNASGSYSRDSGTLAYQWQGPFGTRTTQIVNLNTPQDLPLGVDPITLMVTDSDGQTATDSLTVTVKDTTPPSLSVSLSTGPAPRHSHFVPVHATIAARDSCDSVPPTIKLVSIEVVRGKDHDKDHENDHEKDHDRSDIDKFVRGATFGTADQDFELARGEGRTYIVTYSATDLSGNVTKRSAQVVVKEAHDDD